MRVTSPLLDDELDVTITPNPDGSYTVTAQGASTQGPLLFECLDDLCQMLAAMRQDDATTPPTPASESHPKARSDSRRKR